MGIIMPGSKMEIDYKIKTAKEYEAEGKFLHAIQVYNSIIDEYPEITEPYFNLALIYERIDKINTAVELLRELLESDVHNREVRLFLGQMLLKNHKWDNAVEVLSFIMPDEEPVVSFLPGICSFYDGRI